MAEGLSYSTYAFLDYTFPSVLGSVVIGVQGLITIFLLILSAFNKLNNSVTNALFLYSKVVFSGVLKKDDNGRSLFTIIIQYLITMCLCYHLSQQWCCTVFSYPSGHHFY